MPDKPTCQNVERARGPEGATDEQCANVGQRKVLVPLALGMTVEIWLCRKHIAEYNRRQAEVRLGRRSR